MAASSEKDPNPRNPSPPARSPGEGPPGSPPGPPIDAGISEFARGVVERALELVPDGALVGLGSGRAAHAFVAGLGERVRKGFRVRGVPTSRETAELAGRFGIPLAGPEEFDSIDVAFDGADEVDPALNLIKGYGGALTREKIVASASRRFVVLVGREKQVDVLGRRGRLPLEVIPFGLGFARHRLLGMGFPAELRRGPAGPFLTDNGNYILDCAVGPLPDSRTVEKELAAIPGVVTSGLFLGMANMVLVQDGEVVNILKK